MRYLLIVTMMLPDYAEDIVYQLVQAGFEVGSGRDDNKPCDVIVNSVSSLLSLSLADKYGSTKGTLDIIIGALQKASAKYYSVVAIPESNGLILLAGGNIKLKAGTAKKPSNVIKLTPKIKEPSKLGEAPTDIIDDPK